MCHKIAFQSNCSFRCLIYNILIRTAYQYFAEKEDLILPFSCDICAYIKVPCKTPIDKIIYTTLTKRTSQAWHSPSKSSITLTWAWWSWLSWENLSLHFTVSSSFSQPAVARENGAILFSRSYFYLLYKDTLPITLAVMANAQSVNLEHNNKKSPLLLVE